jgi:hypothetical protein
MFGKIRLLGIVLGAAIILGNAGAACAGDWCAKRIDHERHALDRAIARYGYWSRRADHERQELARLREECRYRY